MGGTAEVPGFYPLENIVLNYDNIGWFSWGGQAVPVTADGTAAPFFSDGKCYSILGGAFQHGITGGANCRTVPYGALTQPSCLPIHRLPNWLCSSNASWQWNMAKVLYSRMYLKGNEAHNYTNYRPVSDFTGKTEVGQWMQCSIPLSELVDETTWGEFQKRDGDELALQMTNPSENGPYNIEMYFDNFRVVKIQ